MTKYLNLKEAIKSCNDNGIPFTFMPPTNSKEWSFAWECLGLDEDNSSFSEPKTVCNNGESWMYYGIEQYFDGSLVHVFRHRDHPKFQTEAGSVYFRYDVSENFEKEFNENTKWE